MLKNKIILTNGNYKRVQEENKDRYLVGKLTIYNNGQNFEYYISKDGNDFNHMCLVVEKQM